MRAVREAVNNDRTFWMMPFQQLFWKIGMTRTTPASEHSSVTASCRH